MHVRASDRSKMDADILLHIVCGTPFYVVIFFMSYAEMTLQASIIQFTFICEINILFEISA